MKALVLKKIPFSESDFIVHFLLENGSLRAGFAGGARKSKRRFPHQFHLAGLYELEWNQKSLNAPGKLSRLQSCELLEFFSPVAENLEALARWMMILEWVGLDPVHEFQFSEIEDLLRNLSRNPKASAYHLFFLNQIRMHGLVPHLKSCYVCGKEIEVDSHFLISIEEGGAGHSFCTSKGLLCEKETLELLRNFFLSEEVLESSSVLSDKVSQDLDEISVPYLEFQLGIPLKVQKFFRQIAPPNPRRASSR